MKFAQGGRRLEKLAGSNKAGSRAPSAPTKWRTLSAGKDPWAERGVEDQAWLREPRPALLREIAQQTLLFPATRAVAMPTIVGAEDLVHAPQPAILAPNHESDIDTPLVLLALPHAWRSRTVVGAASDRFYRKRGYAIAPELLDQHVPVRPRRRAAPRPRRRGRAPARGPQRDALPAGHPRRRAPRATAPASPSSRSPPTCRSSRSTSRAPRWSCPRAAGLNRRGKTTVTFARPLHPRPGETPGPAHRASTRRYRALIPQPVERDAQHPLALRVVAVGRADHAGDHAQHVVELDVRSAARRTAGRARRSAAPRRASRSCRPGRPPSPCRAPAAARAWSGRSGRTAPPRS